MKLIEEYTYDKEGYNPSLISEGWQIAFLNYTATESLDSIDKLDIHLKTDEAFLLLSGQAALIAAKITERDITYDIVDMKQYVIYNIPVNTWHKIAMYPGNKVCIIEKHLTHLSDFKFYHLSTEQKEVLKKEVNRCIKSSK